MRKYKALSGLLFLLVTLCSMPSFAQLNFDFMEGKYLIKGRISDLKTEQGIPNANIWIVNQKRGITVEGDGSFSMYVYPTDTLKFSSLGYITKTIPMSAIAEKDKYTIDMRLVPDIYEINQVVIYPFKNKQEFAEAFVKGKGVGKSFLIYGIDGPKYVHKEKTKYYNPISTIYEQMKKRKQAADPNFKP